MSNIGKIIITLFISVTLFSCDEIEMEQREFISENITVIEGMKGAENILLKHDSNRLYATDCSGYVYMIDGESRDSLKIIKRVKPENDISYTMGLAVDSHDRLYCSASNKEWMKTGGKVYRTNDNLDYFKPITENIRSINGICIDNNDRLYITSGTMNFFNDKGAIYKMDLKETSLDTVLITQKDIKTTNGIYFHNNKVYISETFHGISYFDTIKTEDVKKFNFLLGRNKFIEGFDDFCIDNRGNIWIGDQPKGFVKVFIPSEKRIVFFKSKEIGVIASCRIRVENGEEILYVAEIKQRGSNNYDGRGLFAIPISDFNI